MTTTTTTNTVDVRKCLFPETVVSSPLKKGFNYIGTYFMSVKEYIINAYARRSRPFIVPFSVTSQGILHFNVNNRHS